MASNPATAVDLGTSVPPRFQVFPQILRDVPVLGGNEQLPPSITQLGELSTAKTLSSEYQLGVLAQGASYGGGVRERWDVEVQGCRGAERRGQRSRG